MTAPRNELEESNRQFIGAWSTYARMAEKGILSELPGVSVTYSQVPMPLLNMMFLATPVTNSISRTIEYQADIFGLDAVRKPDAFATVILKLSTYRKLEPGHWEEVIFYDHPSGRTRIQSAMRWKKEHIADTDIRDTANLP